LNLAPTPKVATGAIVGAFSVILVWSLGQFHVQMPPEVASALTTVLSAGAAFFAPRSPPTIDQIAEIKTKL